MNDTKLKTAEIRSGDDKGKHTTTRRELLLLPGGGIIIDTPGMREFSLWNNDMTASDIFSDINEIAAGCRYKDCSHIHEADCEVKNAIEEGIITRQHLVNYFKLKKETEYLDSLIDKNIYLERKKKEKKFGREIKQFYKRGKSKGNL